MKVNKSELVNLIKKELRDNWLTDSNISYHEILLDYIIGGVGESDNKYYSGQDEDIQLILSELTYFKDFKISNIYEIISKDLNWSFKQTKLYKRLFLGIEVPEEVTFKTFKDLANFIAENNLTELTSIVVAYRQSSLSDVEYLKLAFCDGSIVFTRNIKDERLISVIDNIENLKDVYWTQNKNNDEIHLTFKNKNVFSTGYCVSKFVLNTNVIIFDICR